MAEAGSQLSNSKLRPTLLTFAIDTHHLFYILVCLDALGYHVGSLDLKAVNPSRPINYVDLKIPALSLRAPGPKRIVEIVADPPNENALPLDSFRNLQSLECLDIDPRTLLELMIKRSGLDDISNCSSTQQATPSLDPFSLSRQSSSHTTRLPDSVAEHAEETLPPSKWVSSHLSLTVNALTFIPTEILPHLSSLTHHNMFDSILDIYKKLGQVLALNLSRNRLDSLCGLERLVALERVGGNESESDYRVKCFDSFWKEGKSTLLDGTPAGFYERRSLSSPPPERMNSTRPMPKAYSPPVVPQQSPQLYQRLQSPQPRRAAPALRARSHPQSPLPAISAKPRKKRAKRIVHLDAKPANASAARTWVAVSEEPSEHFSSPASASRSPLGAPAPSPLAPEAPLALLLLAEDSTTPKALDVVPPKHRRSHTEYAPALALADSDGPLSPVLAPGEVEDGVWEEIKEADAFRARVEALRSEMGDGWLKVFSQSHAGGSG
ncbi:hypothetical protein EDB85DRAFT_2135474 [Lactarius pseudohatsudake]|nr:hypothetical protein EDB85DRAFT_2135474 [Lactarius pseudohatsudake]